jgi:polysaccharide deacetylase 2 family uncharacterized protein YibQ
MKTLFYTATAVFITLAGVIAYFALQPPTSVGGARIVLDIDASAMPATDDPNGAKTTFDPYPGSDDEKPAAQPDRLASPPPERQDPGGDVISDLSKHQPPEEDARLATARPEIGAQQSDDARSSANLDAPVDPADAPSLPPGTTLAGLDRDRPLFREIKPETQAASPVERDSNDIAVADPTTIASRDQELPAANVALPAASPPEPALLRAPATLPAGVAQVRAPPSPPPPFPVRRPNDIPSIEDRISTTGNSWAGAQFATAEIANKTAEIANKPARVALLLRGVGRNDQDNADAIGSLPPAISLGFWPYGTEGGRLASRARERGHEVIVQLPLEPADYPARNVGPNTLMTWLPPEQNAQRLQEVLKRFEGHSGVTNLMGGKMLHEKAPLKPVLEDLKARGLIYVGESTGNHATVRELAREINLRFGAADVLIDAQPGAEAIDKSLSRLVAIARQRGSAIGIGSATAVTVQQVHEWTDTLAAQGITLVPVGALTQGSGSS